MTLKELKLEQIKEMSMVEIAFELLKEEKQPFAFHDLVKRVAEIKQLTDEEVAGRISYLYTDFNIDGRFISLGENRWGLKTWYPYEQADEEVPQTTRRKKAKVADDDFEEDFDEIDGDLEDEYEDLEDELDELVSEEDEDDTEDEDFDDLDDLDEEEENLDEDDEDVSEEEDDEEIF